MAETPTRTAAPGSPSPGVAPDVGATVAAAEATGSARGRCFAWWASFAGLAAALALDGLFLLLRAQLDLDISLDDPALLAVAAATVLVGGAVTAWVARHFGFLECALLALLHALPVGAIGWYGLTVSANYFMRMRALSPAAMAGIVVSVALASCVFAWLGASVAYLFGAGGRFDGSFGFELGVAKSHLRLGWGAVNALSVVPLGFLVATELPAALRSGSGPSEWGIAALVVVALVLALARLWRDVWRARGHKRPGTMVMSFISIAGVGIGVWALVVVLSVMGGFEGDLKKKILGTNAHAVVMKYTGEFAEYKDVEKKIRNVPGVIGTSPFTINEVMISSEANITGSVLKGIDPQTVGQVTDLAKNVEEGRLDYLSDPSRVPPPSTARKGRDEPHGEERPQMPAIAIGREMARGLRVGVGDTVNVIAPLGEMGPTGPIPKAKPFRVGAVFQTGMYEYDSKFAYIALPEAQRFFNLGKSVSGIELKMANIDQARAVKLRVLEALEGFPYRAKDWGEMNKNLFSALKLEKRVMFIILTFIVLVACCNILSTLIMMVTEKGREIAILKSMGARDASVMKVFVLEGLIIGAMGAVFGVITGLASCRFVEKYGIALDPEVYYIGALPVRVDPAQIALVAFTAMALSYAATIFPAVKASRLPPVEGLRVE